MSSMVPSPARDEPFWRRARRAWQHDESSALRRLGSFLFADLMLFGRRARRAAGWMRDRYFQADPRTLGLFRIVLGAMLILDGARHWFYAETFYSNAGVLSNHFHLFRPSSGFNFSLFHAFSSLTEVHIAFALSLGCYLALLLGYRTRLFSVLSCIWVTSMDSRMVMVENGGYVVVNLLAFWSMFLPLGQRFSIDSLRRSWKEQKERRPADLNRRLQPSWLDTQRVSLASFIVILNLGIVYAFNVVNKYGGTWRKGQTVHYVLHIDRMVTGIAVWFREYAPSWMLWGSTHVVLIVEALIMMLIFWPRWRLYTRPIAMVGMVLLHGTLGIMMRLGPFSWFLLVWSVLLLQRCHWEAITAWAKKRTARATVVFDPRSPLAFAACRLVMRLDRLQRLQFAPATTAINSAPPPLIALRGAHGGVVGGARGIWAITRRLPGGRALTPALRLLSLGLVGPALALAERWRRPLAAFFWSPTPRGKTKRLTRRLDEETSTPPPEPTIAPLHARLQRYRSRLRELVLIALLAMATSQLINENKSIPKPLKHKQPRFVRAILTYPRIFQGWGMFSPNPIRDDGTLAVDAITIDGRHVDPFTGDTPDLNLSDARGMGLGQIPQDYFNRIRLDRNRAFRKPLRDFLKRYHKRTGRAADELVAIDVYWLVDQSPRPGDQSPFDHEAICLLSWRKIGHKPKAPLGKLPPRCKVKSAGK